jgi:hypothetical protein
MWFVYVTVASSFVTGRLGLAGALRVRRAVRFHSRLAATTLVIFGAMCGSGYAQAPSGGQVTT